MSNVHNILIVEDRFIKKYLYFFQRAADEPKSYDTLYKISIVQLLFPSYPNQENIMIV